MSEDSDDNLQKSYESLIDLSSLSDSSKIDDKNNDGFFVKEEEELIGEDGFSIENDDSNSDDYEYDQYDEFSDIETITKSKIDVFLINVYKYFLRRGFKNIVVSQVLNLFSVTFFVMFCLFLFSCVDFNKISSMRDPGIAYKLSDAVDWRGFGHMHWYLVICLIIYICFFGWRCMRIGYDIHKMKEMKNFYNNHLQISEFELKTIRWQKVLEKLETLQAETNFYLGNEEFSAHNVANRILKKDNYLIAMFNKNIFNFNIPYIDKYVDIPIFTRGMEWNIQYCIMNFIFDDRMKLKADFRDPDKRIHLANDLKKRLMVMGILNIFLLPFLFLFLLFYGLFKYGQDIYKNPTIISNREWTLMAEWRFKEFNELPHVFIERMKLSSKFADEYLQQFPNYWLSNVCRLIAFISSTFLGILLLITINNDHVLFNLEISGGKTVFWYMWLFSTILLVSKSLIKEDYIFYPDKKMAKMAEYIHYIPEEWKEKASNSKVKVKFMKLYQYRIYSLIIELLGLIINPILMFTRLRESCLDIVDFIRDYTTSNQHLGYVCQFAVFEMDDNIILDSTKLERLNDDCVDDKLSKSVYHFQKTYAPSYLMSGIMRGGRGGLSKTTQDINNISIIPTAAQSMMSTPPHVQYATGAPSKSQFLSPYQSPNPNPHRLTDEIFRSQLHSTDQPHFSTFTSEMLIQDIDKAKQKENTKKDTTMLDLLPTRKNKEL